MAWDVSDTLNGGAGFDTLQREGLGNMQIDIGKMTDIEAMLGADDKSGPPMLWIRWSRTVRQACLQMMTISICSGREGGWWYSGIASNCGSDGALISHHWEFASAASYQALSVHSPQVGVSARHDLYWCFGAPITTT